MYVYGTLMFLHVCCRLQNSLFCLSAATAGVAEHGEADKDSHHEDTVQAAGGIFVHLVVETF